MDAEPGGILYLQEFFSDSVNEITFSFIDDDKSLRKESKMMQTKKQSYIFSITAPSFASISIFPG